MSDQCNPRPLIGPVDALVRSSELGELGWVEERVAVPSGSATTSARRRRMLDAATAAIARPPSTAASATAGAGVLDAGVPLPQVASMQLSGIEGTGVSASCTISVALPCVAASTPWGMKPPTTAAAMAAISPNRHFMRMASRYVSEISPR